MTAKRPSVGGSSGYVRPARSSTRSKVQKARNCRTGLVPCTQRTYVIQEKRSASRASLGEAKETGVHKGKVAPWVETASGAPSTPERAGQRRGQRAMRLSARAGPPVDGPSLVALPAADSCLRARSFNCRDRRQHSNQRAAPYGPPRSDAPGYAAERRSRPTARTALQKRPPPGSTLRAHHAFLGFVGVRECG